MLLLITMQPLKCSNCTCVAEEILAYGNRLRTTHCMQFPYLKLSRSAYLFRTTQLIKHGSVSDLNVQFEKEWWT